MSGPSCNLDVLGDGLRALGWTCERKVIHGDWEQLVALLVKTSPDGSVYHYRVLATNSGSVAISTWLDSRSLGELVEQFGVYVSDPWWRDALGIIARALGAEPVAPPAPDAATRELVIAALRAVDQRPVEGDLYAAYADRLRAALADRLLPPGAVAVRQGDVAMAEAIVRHDAEVDRKSDQVLARAGAPEEFALADRLRAALGGRVATDHERTASMTRVVHKLHLEPGEVLAEVPAGSAFLAVGWQSGLVAWYERHHDREVATAYARFLVVATGQPFDKPISVPYLGTENGGGLVWHVYGPEWLTEGAYREKLHEHERERDRLHFTL